MSATSPSTDFLKYVGTLFEPYILPIIPAGAKLSEESSLVAEQLGKIPGSFAWGPKVWYGFSKWQVHHTRKGDLKRWQEWQEPHFADTAIALALRLGILIAIDIDINNPKRADQAEIRAVMLLGKPLCVRRREGSARRVLIYVRELRILPITKARVAWTIEGETGVEAVEILGHGQQVVIEGPHAKGAMHYWLDGKGLVDLTEDEIKGARKLTHNDIFRLTLSLTEWIKGQGGEIHVASGKAMRERPLETAEIESPTNPFYLPPKERGLLVEAMQAINLDRNVDYDVFVNLQRALCAATGCDVGFLSDKVWAWVCTQKEAHGSGPRTEERGIEWLEEMWRGFKSSSLGADYVYRVAASFGFTKGMELGDAELAALFGAPVEKGDAAGGDDAGVAADGVGRTGGGPLPPRDTHISLRNLFIEQHGQIYRFIPELGFPKGWHAQSDGLWRPAYPEFASAVADHCSVEGDLLRRTMGKPGAQADRALKSATTHSHIERMLAKTPAIVSPLKIFDTKPDLLNASRFVIDLHTMTAHEHDPSDLFRLCTAVSPDFGVRGPPVRWLSVLERLSVGRPWLPEALQIWFGYTLTGYTDWQYILFIPGNSGTGKSIIIRVVCALMGSYAKAWKPERFILRRQQDDRFALNDMSGLRGIFGTEMIDNATWYETRLVQICDGEELDTEIKGGAQTSIKSQAKISIAGNNEPRFPAGDREGGLPRRMMRLLIGPEYKLVDGVNKDTELLKTLIEEEGPQILTWMLEGAWKALNQGPKRFRTLAQPLFDAANQYVQEADPRRQFLEARRIVQGDLSKDYILLSTLYHDYLSFRQTGERGFFETQKVFKNAMSEIFGQRWEPVHRGEKDKNKHGYVAIYGWKYSGGGEATDNPYEAV